MTETNKIRVIKKAERPVRDPMRSEASLLEILIERNPERAQIIIRKILVAKDARLISNNL